MEIKTTQEIIDNQFITKYEKHTLRTIKLNPVREDIGKYRFKKWVAVDDLKLILNNIEIMRSSCGCSESGAREFKKRT